MTDDFEILADLVFKAVRIAKEMREIENQINEFLKGKVADRPYNFHVWERIDLNDD